MRYLITTLLLALCTLGAQAQPRELVIFHTNDIHGHFTAERASWRKDSALVGGMDALYYHLQELRKQHPNSIYLDAGDLMTGNPICNMEYNGVKGEALPEMLYRCGVAAECIGNHEFDLGAQHLKDYVKAAKYPMLSSNLTFKEGDVPVTDATHVFDENGVKVGVIGVILNDLADVVSSKSLTPFRVFDASETAQKYVDELRPKVNLVILLTHEGVEADSILATKVKHVDVIVGGHSHTRLKAPMRVNGVIIVQAGSYLKDLGVLDLTLAGDSEQSYNGHLEELTLPPTPRKNNVSALADSFETVIQAKYGEVIGELGENWVPGYYVTSNVGNWICDRLRERYKADVALVNAGGIRAPMNKGPVTMLNVLQLLPFVNTIVTFDVKGSDLQTMALEQARAQSLRKHGVLEMSGMTVTYTMNGDSIGVVTATVGGKPLDPAATYRIVSMDYVAESSWKEYLKFQPTGVKSEGELISDAVADEIHKIKGPIHSDATPRVQETH